MSLPANTNCSTIYQVPGPTGAAGAAGTNGTNGVNAYSTTTASFVMPAVGDGVAVAVDSCAWMTAGTNVNGQIIHIQNAGYFFVDAILSGTSIHVNNVGYAGNAPSASVIPVGQRVAPAGLQGPAGPSGVAGTLNQLSPTTTKGDLIVDDGLGGGAAADVRFGAGTNGSVLHADSAQALGLRYSGVDLSGSATTLLNTLALTKGGTAVDNSSVTANKVWAGPAAGGAGAASYRSLVADDLTGLVPGIPVTVANGGTGVTALPSFEATMSGGQTIGNGSTNKIAFDTKTFDSNTNYDAAVNRRFTPTVAGKYRISAHVGYNLAASTQMTLLLYKNGSPLRQDLQGNVGFSVGASQLDAVVEANGTTDYFEMFVASSGGNVFLTGGNDCWFCANWAGN